MERSSSQTEDETGTIPSTNCKISYISLLWGVGGMETLIEEPATCSGGWWDH